MVFLAGQVYDFIEILEGLEPGQRIVIKGFLDLIDKKKVKDISTSAARTASPQG